MLPFETWIPIQSCSVQNSFSSNINLCSTQFAGIDAVTLPGTGERIVPGMVGTRLFREHEVRYLFAGGFVNRRRVLDVACGTGIGTHYLRRAGAESCFGVDRDQGAIRYARQKYKNCDFCQCEATRLCLADATVDVVVSFETIEHIRDQDAFLVECKRVLRPGGIFICSTPNRTLARWGADNPFHFRELAVSEFENQVKAVFGNVNLYAQNVRTYPMYVARALLRKLLVKLEVAELAMRVLSRNPSATTHREEFGEASNSVEGEIVSWSVQMLRQPMFVVAVTRKLID